MTTHTEQIKCPECGIVQDATVKHTAPFLTYIHDCKICGYTIMESEWNAVCVIGGTFVPCETITEYETILYATN